MADKVLSSAFKVVLVISYEYPPMTTGGVQRPSKFVKYLPEYGYQPVVVTTKSASNSDDGPSGNILRYEDDAFGSTIVGQALYQLYRTGRHCAWKLGIWPWRYMWYREVMNGIIKIHEDHKPGIVFATYPPIENLMLGFKISHRFHLPLVLDFRDGMVFEPSREWPFFVWKKLKSMERLAVQRASAVITVSDPISDYFREKYPGTRVYTISNGFDRDDWEGIGSMDLGNTINIVHTGRLGHYMSDKSVKPLLDAVQQLSRIERDTLKIHMVGGFPPLEKELLASEAFKDIFHEVGFVSREKALEYQRSADILLLMAGSRNKGMATGKLFEYLLAGKPILGLTKGTVAERIIAETGTGICVDPYDTKEITGALRMLIQNHGSYSFFRPDPSAISKYSRKELTGQLAAVFDGSV